MGNANPRLLTGALAALACSAAFASAEIRREPLHFQGSLEGGVFNSVRGTDEVPYEGVYHNRLGLWIDQEAYYNDNLRFNMGLGGMFWYSFPPGGGNAFTKSRRFAFGISQASFTYDFDKVPAGDLSVTVGQFPFKYNPDAYNLGEYLFRTRAYPVIMQTGGWVVVNSANASVLGVDFTHTLLDGKIKQDLIISSETDIAPLYDVSVAYVGTYKPVNGIEIGAGVSFDRLLSARPSMTTPESWDNAYFYWQGDSLNPAGEYSARDSVVSASPYFTQAVRDSIPKNYYSFKAIRAVGRASFDIKPFVGLDDGAIFGREDLKIFSEVAVLGFKDAPRYYEDIKDRMPIMFGMNLPAFGALDVLSVQFEHLSNRYANDYYTGQWNGYPIPYEQNWNPETQGSKDDWKWSVFARRSFDSGIGLMVQVASDHYRPVNEYNQFTTRSALNDSKKDWYYLARLTWGF